MITYLLQIKKSSEYAFKHKMAECMSSRSFVPLFNQIELEKHNRVPLYSPDVLIGFVILVRPEESIQLAYT